MSLLRTTVGYNGWQKWKIGKTEVLLVEKKIGLHYSFIQILTTLTQTGWTQNPIYFIHALII